MFSKLTRLCTFLVIYFSIHQAVNADSTTVFNASDSAYIDACVRKINERMMINEQFEQLGQYNSIDYVIDIREEVVKQKFPLSRKTEVVTIANEIASHPTWKNCINYYVLITNYVSSPGVKMGVEDILETYQQNPSLFDNLSKTGITSSSIKSNLQQLQAIKADFTSQINDRHEKILEEIRKRSKLSTSTKLAILQSLIYHFVSNDLNKLIAFGNISLDGRILSGQRDIFKDNVKKTPPIGVAHDKTLYPFANAIKTSLNQILTGHGSQFLCQSVASSITKIPDANFSGQYLSLSGQILCLPPGKHQLVAAVKCGSILAFKILEGKGVDDPVYVARIIQDATTKKFMFQGYFDSKGTPYLPSFQPDFSKKVYSVNDYVIENTTDGDVAVPKLSEFNPSKFLIGKDDLKNEVYLDVLGNQEVLFALKEPSVPHKLDGNFSSVLKYKDIANNYYQLLQMPPSRHAPYDYCISGEADIVQTNLYYGQFISNQISSQGSTLIPGIMILSIPSYTPLTGVTPPTAPNNMPKSKLSILYKGKIYYDNDVIFIPNSDRNVSPTYKVNDINKMYNSYDWWSGAERVSSSTAGDNSHEASSSRRAYTETASLSLQNYASDYRGMANLSLKAWDSKLSPNENDYDEITRIKVVRPEMSISYFNSEEYPLDEKLRFGYADFSTEKVIVPTGDPVYLCYTIYFPITSITDVDLIRDRLEIAFLVDGAAHQSLPKMYGLKSCLKIPSLVSTNITSAVEKKVTIQLFEKGTANLLYSKDVTIRYLVKEKLIDLMVQEEFEVADYNKPTKGRIGNAGQGRGLYIVTCPIPVSRKTVSFSGPINYKLVTPFDDKTSQLPKNTAEDRNSIKVKWKVIEQVYDNSLLAGSASGIVTEPEEEIKYETGYNLTYNIDSDQKRLVALYNPASTPVILKRIISAEAFGQKIQTEVYFVYYSKASFEFSNDKLSGEMVQKVKEYVGEFQVVAKRLEKVEDYIKNNKYLEKVVSALGKVEVGMEPIAWDCYNEEKDQSRFYYHTYDPKIAGSAAFNITEKEIPLNFGPFGWAANVVQKFGGELGFYLTFKSEVKLMPEFHWKVQHTKPSGPVETSKSFEVVGEGGFDVGLKAAAKVPVSKYRGYAEGHLEPRLTGKMVYDFDSKQWEGSCSIPPTVFACSIGVEEKSVSNPGKYEPVVSFKESLEIFPEIKLTE